MRKSSSGITFIAKEETFASIPTKLGSPLRILDLRAHGGIRVLRPDVGGDDAASRSASHDHPYQRGLRIAHADVGGHDLWTDDSGIELESSTLHMGPNGSARVRARLSWRAPDGALLCSETRTIALASFEGLRLLDVTTRIAATGEGLDFGDVKDGLFALRLADDLAGRTPGTRVFDSEGREGTAIRGQRARWVAHAGRAPGEDGAALPVTVVVLDHPSNPRAPCRWQVRPYGIVAANPFGRSAFEEGSHESRPFRVPAYGAVDLRYRVALADRILSSREVNVLWDEFAGLAARSPDGTARPARSE